MPSIHSFYQLCAGELVVVLAGLVSLPAAIFLQVLVPLIIFRESIVPPAYHPVPIAGVFILGTIIFAAALFFFRHTFIPLIFLAAFVVFTWFSLILAGTRLQRRFGGTP